MRLWSEERRLGTIELLLTMPMAAWQAIVRQVSRLVAVPHRGAGPSFPIVATVNWLGIRQRGDRKRLRRSGAPRRGLPRDQLLHLGSHPQPGHRLILAVVLCLFLILGGVFAADGSARRAWASPWLVEAVSKFSVLTHYDGFQKGVLDSRDLLYFLSVMAVRAVRDRGRHPQPPHGLRGHAQEDRKSAVFGRWPCRRRPDPRAPQFVLGAARGRIDLTQGRLYTLSEGTRAVLGSSSPRSRSACTSARATSPLPIKAYGRRVEDLLAEFRQAGRGKVTVEKLDPQPDSDAEDSATLEGVEAQVTPSGDKFYLGASISYADQKLALPALAPDREPLLEYDLVRAIARAARRRSRDRGDERIAGVRHAAQSHDRRPADGAAGVSSASSGATTR